jgi:hypothetical protein
MIDGIVAPSAAGDRIPTKPSRVAAPLVGCAWTFLGLNCHGSPRARAGRFNFSGFFLEIGAKLGNLSVANIAEFGDSLARRFEGMRTFRAGTWLFAMAVSATLSVGAYAQGSSGAGTSGSWQEAAPAAKHVMPGTPAYQKPTAKQTLRQYAFDSIGPYAWIRTVAAAGIQQATNSAPEWGQGWDAYGVRVASNLGINLVATATRYGLGQLFREDVIYYRCDCTGFVPRLEHALILTLASRRGEDGHLAFSVPKLVAPYAGTLTAVYGWYPERYKAMDGFRMGNFLLLDGAGINVAKEFIWGGPHTLMARTPLKGITGSKEKNQNNN